MKKSIGILVLLICLIGSNSAHSQVQFGLKAGLNFNNPSFSGLLDGYEANKTTGFLVGPVMDFKIPFVGLGLEASALYSQRSLKFSFDDGVIHRTNMKSTQHALEIPVNLKYSFGLEGLASLFVLAGPDFIFNLNSSNIIDKLHEVASGPEMDNPVNAFELGFNLGIGFKLLDSFQFSASYMFPLTNNLEADPVFVADSGTIFKSNNEKFKSKNRTWQLAIAYFF